MPVSRIEYWRRKFDATVARDQRSIEALTLDGWKVLVIWECEAVEGAFLEERLIGFLGCAKICEQGRTGGT
jgi:DNA mismatch endonuclease (patch repair protein)